MISARLRTSLGLGALLIAVGAAPALASTGPDADDPSQLAVLQHAGILTGDLNGVPAPPDVAADSWIVADADTGAILAAKRAMVPHLPASTMKVLTALTVAHQLNPNSLVKAPSDVQTIDGTRVGLVPNSTYSVHALLTAMLIASGNDAAQTLAVANGGVDHTLAAMRDEAARLQANSTVPGTPSGLDAPGQHTTAYDLALIGRAALDDPIVAPYLTITRATLQTPGSKSFEIGTHNPLLGRYAGTIGVKDGYTTAAQATYIGAAKRTGHRIIVTLMYAYPHFIPAATALLDWGFDAREKVTPLATLAHPLSDAEIAARAAAKQPKTAVQQQPSSVLASAKEATIVAAGESALRRRTLNAFATIALALATLRWRALWMTGRQARTRREKLAR